MALKASSKRVESYMVSVIVPVFNREKKVGHAIESVLCQTYKDFEIIIIDDASTDNTVRIVEEYSNERINLIMLDKNSGAAKARNVGMSVARGEYIAFLDSDDVWDKHYLERQLIHMEAEKAQAVFCAFRHTCDGYTYIIPNEICKKNIVEHGVQNTLKKGNFIGMPTLIMRRDVLSKVGEFDEKLHCLEDYEFVIRLSMQCKIVFLDEVLVDAYVSDNSVTRKEALHVKAFEHLLALHPGYYDEDFLIEYLSRKARYERNSVEVRMVLDAYFRNANHGTPVIQKDVAIYLRLFAVMCEKERNYDRIIKGVSDKSFVIYGAGEVARQVYFRLSNEGLHPLHFVVTKKEEKTWIDGIEVIEAGRLKEKDTLIIVAVSDGLQDEIIRTLRDRDLNNYFLYSM